jgi:pyruvate, water dikinase
MSQVRVVVESSAAEAPIRWFDSIKQSDADVVGGKAAALGELYSAFAGDGVRIPNGFVTTADAYHEFLDGDVADAWDELAVEPHLAGLKVEAARSANLREALAVLLRDLPAGNHLDMHERAMLARAFVFATPLPGTVRSALADGYRRLCEEYGGEVDTAVRSSATKEDLEIASFAGQYESFLNVRGVDQVVDAWKRCVASAFTERAVSYQLGRGMDPLSGALAVVVMKMVRSDLATSGVMFTIDPDSGNPNVIHLSSAYGLGELVVQGSVSPDTFVIWKEGLRRGGNALVHRTLGAKDRKMVYSVQGGTATESVDVEASHRRRWSLHPLEALELGRMALRIEDYYGTPMDIEWAKDGYSGELYVVQARPETVHSALSRGHTIETYSMDPALVAELEATGKVLVEGQAVGEGIASGRVRVYADYEEVIVRKRELRTALGRGEDLADIRAEDRVFDPGDVLVTEMTTPDWEPIMKEASLIVTERGGRTSHAAIVAREFGIPAIVGCDDATRILTPLQEVTGSCAEGDTGLVFDGAHPYQVERTAIDELPDTDTLVKLNVGFPDKALRDSMLPSDGVGLARIEFILTAQVGIHPLALLYYDELVAFSRTGEVAQALEPYVDRLTAEDPHELATLLGAIERRTPSYADRREFFVDQLKYGVALICAAFYPRPVLVRLSDLKSNEYHELLGGRLFEPVEENPMIAWRGAARYVDPRFLPAFDMECEALRFVRQQIGLDNLQIMVPFCRTPEEGSAVRDLLDQRGLSPQAGVPLYLMVELPANVVEAERFITEMDLSGGSIGTNDLVQTVYALSRDDLEHYHGRIDARSPAVTAMVRQAIDTFNAHGLEIGICGQAPSDHPDEVPAFLVGCGISSISVTPDTVVPVRLAVARAEGQLARDRRDRNEQPAARRELSRSTSTVGLDEPS